MPTLPLPAPLARLLRACLHLRQPQPAATGAPAPHAPAATWRAPCGTALRVRPLCPADTPLLDDLFDGLSPRSRRLRFHAALRRLPPQQLAWLASPDFARRGGCIVTRLVGGMELAVAEGMWVRSGPAGHGEFALSVADAWQHQGLGRRLLQHLADSARAHGLQHLHGDVLPGNVAMQALAGSLQFETASHPDEPPRHLGQCTGWDFNGQGVKEFFPQFYGRQPKAPAPAPSTADTPSATEISAPSGASAS